jgi:hypothetical protein
MKNFSLAVVLSLGSVFSISAQTDNQSTEKTAPRESVKVESERPQTEIAPAETIDKTPEIKVATEEKKPAVSEPVKKPDLPVSAVKKSSLGMLSTGNSTVDGYIEEFSELYDIDPLLIYAQMNQESSFNARAVSPKGASGFMQLTPDTARRFGVTNIYNPKQNIKAGVKYMRWLLDKFGGDTRLALAGYNAGEGAVIKYGNKIPPYRETQNYVARIMNHYELITDQNQTLAQTDQK